MTEKQIALVERIIADNLKRRQNNEPNKYNSTTQAALELVFEEYIELRNDVKDRLREAEIYED